MSWEGGWNNNWDNSWGGESAAPAPAPSSGGGRNAADWKFDENEMKWVQIGGFAAPEATASGTTGDEQENDGDRRSKRMTYPKELKEEHGELKEMWRQMSSALDEATEDTLPGILETAHAALTTGFESDPRIFNNGELSRIFEKLIEWSSAVHVRGIYFKIINSLPYLLMQKCASRVIEKLFRQCHHLLSSDSLSKNLDEEDSTGLPTLNTLLSRSIEVLVEGDVERNIAFIDLMQETGGSHALRVFAAVLAGREPPAPGGRPRRGDHVETKTPPVDEGQAIKKFGKAVIKQVAASDIFANRCRATPVSALIQVLITVWEDGSKPMYEQIAADVAGLLKNNTSSFIVEAALRSDRGHPRMHAYFLENWKSCSAHAASSWAAGCATVESHTEMIDALLADAEHIKSTYAYALVAGAAESAGRFPSNQTKAMTLATTVFACDLNSLTTTLVDMQDSGSKAGLTILAHLLAFGPSKIGKLYKGIVDLPKPKLTAMMQNSSCSYVLEGFIKMGTDKDLKRFAAQLEGKFLAIACSNVSACIIIERLFDKLTLMYRRKVVEELAKNLSSLQEQWFTKKLIKKLRLEQFVHRLSDWEESEKKMVKKAKLMHSIMNAAAATDGIAQADGKGADPAVDEMAAIFGGGDKDAKGKGKKRKAEDAEKKQKKRKKD